jgi:hypothetical protein
VPTHASSCTHTTQNLPAPRRVHARVIPRPSAPIERSPWYFGSASDHLAAPWPDSPCSVMSHSLHCANVLAPPNHPSFTAHALSFPQVHMSDVVSTMPPHDGPASRRPDQSRPPPVLLDCAPRRHDLPLPQGRRRSTLVHGGCVGHHLRPRHSGHHFRACLHSKTSSSKIYRTTVGSGGTRSSTSMVSMAMAQRGECRRHLDERAPQLTPMAEGGREHGHGAGPASPGRYAA